ncbi:MULTISPECIES: dethiobiotin synthase [unclassified Iodidimonas]|jgi:dethiobiotin synthetase|uniref:dethiobiotin synthase n=1 Tax=unclassified Iodidimonas TaxID=2626145 RepID=UPI0024831F3C|nr:MULTISPECIES: dethiobiotin synthase [unclassified Iodidimonas]
MAGLFITATGTRIGKTLLTAALVHQLRHAGRRVQAIKPIISGYAPKDETSDTALLLKALGRPSSAAADISPWRFAAPLSPDMAAALEGRRLPYPALLAFCRQAMAAPGLTLIEGVGGAFVPLDDRHLVADWIADLGCPHLLVTGSYLGSLSHSLSCIEGLAHRGLAPSALIVSDSPDHPAAIPLNDTCKSLSRHISCPIISLPRLDGPDPWAHAPDLLAVLDRLGIPAA